MSQMKIALVPLNPIVGDVFGNAEKITGFVREAIAKECQLVVFPELSLIGYPPRDLVHLSILRERQSEVLHQLLRLSKKITIIVGGIDQHKGTGPALTNTAYVLRNGQKLRYTKRLLPNYDVFDEPRYFSPGKKPLCFKLGGLKIALTICEDIWFDEASVRHLYRVPIKNELKRLKPDLIINIAASPYDIDKNMRRQRLFSQVARELGSPLIFINQSGANDDLIFDGKISVTSEEGQMLFESPGFQERIFIFDTLAKQNPLPSIREDKTAQLNSLKKALVTGIQDYVQKTGGKDVVLGLSGGIDSALVAQLATEALGAENVLGVLMPSRYSSRGSIIDARELARRLKIDTVTIDIEPLHRLYERSFKKIFGHGGTKETTAQNIQARLRGNLLMAISNNTGRLLLNTTNKSEMAMGYGTLYGDMCGALGVIADLTKTLVYKLARHLNPHFEIIPEQIMSKIPSAELKPNQKDSDTLPEYDTLDPLVEQWVTLENISQTDFKQHAKLLKTLWQNEFKRKQSAIGLRVTAKSFGSGRRMPVVGKL